MDQAVYKDKVQLNLLEIIDSVKNIWSESLTLKKEDVNIEKTFFEQGGYSLLAI